jgi:hypothetical protein
MELGCSQLLVQDAMVSFLDSILRPNFDLKQRFGDWTASILRRKPILVGLVGRASAVSETLFQIQIMVTDSVQKICHCVNIQSAFVIL